jgi:hypothetical protein
MPMGTFIQLFSLHRGIFSWDKYNATNMSALRALLLIYLSQSHAKCHADFRRNLRATLTAKQVGQRQPQRSPKLAQASACALIL